MRKWFPFFKKHAIIGVKNMTLDEKLYKLRTDKGITQAKLADHLSVTRQTVSKWETGEAIPSTDNLKRLSTFYNVPLEYLVLTSEQSDKMMTQEVQLLPNQVHENESSTENEKVPASVGKGISATRRWVILGGTVAILILICCIVLWVTKPATNNISLDETGKKEVSVLSEDSFDFTF